MNETIRKRLEDYGVDLSGFEFVDKTCNNIKLRDKKTGRVVDFRW